MVSTMLTTRLQFKDELQPSAEEQQPGRARTRCSRPCMEIVGHTKTLFTTPAHGWPGIKGDHGDRPVRWDSKRDVAQDA